MYAFMNYMYIVSGRRMNEQTDG